MSVQLHHADAVQWAREYQGEKAHALLCDPPYALTNRVPDVKACADCGRVLGGNDGHPGNCPRCGGLLIYQRSQSERGGFMGKKWDNEIAFTPSTWAAFANVLHDGAFIFAFASSRGWHRQAVAMEDAGLIIHPSIFGLRMLGYTFGSGFPKSTRVKDEPAFAGHRYGLQALKPALEPIIVAQKPYKGKPVACITRTGAGSLNIDAARIPANGESLSGGMINGTSKASEGWDRPWRHDPEAIERNKAIHAERIAHAEAAGRWPAHFYVDEHGAAALDAQSGESKSVRSMRGEHADIRGDNYNRSNGATVDGSDSMRGYNDQGGVSRFFFNAVADQIDDADAVMYCAKASRRERDAGLDGMPLRVGTQRMNASAERWEGGREPTPRAEQSLQRNPHPTVKPISLTRWLATLLLPPAEYAPRRLFVPFAGAGSECIGAALAGWDKVIGVEMMNDEEHPYVDIARARVAHWLKQPALIGGAA